MRLPVSLRDAPLKRKLMFIATLATAGAMLSAMLLSAAMQWFMLRDELAKNVYAHASIIAANSTSALLFGDREAAEQTLGALAAIDSIEFAQLFDKTGRELAVYVRTGSMMPLQQHPAGGGSIYTTKYIEVVMPVVFKQEQIGFIHVRSDLVPVYEQLAWRMLVIVLAAGGALLVAVMMLYWLIPTITAPLLKLTELMNVVSRDKDYTQRVRLYGKDELGILAQGFNDMLAQIQQRDDELARHREHLEEEVAKRTARLTEAQRIAHLGNWEWDIVNNTLDWSDEIYRIFGLTPQKFVPSYEAFLQLVHPDDKPLVEERVRQALEQGSVYSQDHRIWLPDGTVRHVHEQGEVTVNEEKRAVRMAGTVRDITESKQAEEKINKLNEELEIKVRERTGQLLQAQEELVRKEKLSVLGQVAGSVGHELRNPLGVMSNAVFFLQAMSSDADEITKEYLNIIKSEIGNSERIVADLLDSVRTQPPHPESASVRQIIEQTLRKLTIPSNVRITLDMPETQPVLWVDVQQMQQVLRNLVSNGVDAMPDGGELEISAVADELARNVTVSVRDSGSGMTPNQLEKLFQPLYTTKARGIGLGLVVVKNLTQANGGTVAVQSEQGKGSKFSITLPSAVAAAGAET